DITEIKQAEESQQLLAESSRILSGSLEVEQTLPALAGLVAERIAETCAVHVLEDGELFEVARAGVDADEPAWLRDVIAAGAARAEPGVLVVPIRGRESVAGTLTLLGGAPDAVVAEDLAVRIGAALDNSRLYLTRAAIAQTLQRSLLPPELPDIP